MKKDLYRSFITVTYFMFTSVILLRFVCLKITTSNKFVSQNIAPIIVKFQMKHIQTPGSQNYEFGSGRISKMASDTKISKTTIQLLLQNRWIFSAEFRHEIKMKHMYSVLYKNQ